MAKWQPGLPTSALTVLETSSVVRGWTMAHGLCCELADQYDFVRDSKACESGRYTTSSSPASLRLDTAHWAAGCSGVTWAAETEGILIM